MNRRKKTWLMLGAVAALAVTLLIIWCPPAACRLINIHTYALSALDDYRQLVADEEAFYSSRRARAVRIDCAALRDEVVTAVTTGSLVLETRPDDAQQSGSGQGTIEAWHQGRLLHLTNNALRTDIEQQAWAARVRAAVTTQRAHDLAFLSRLFGGVVLHVSHRQIPIVLFSDHPCV